MFTHRPLVLALGACLLQACVAPPTKQAVATELAIQPVLRVRHSSDQSAATYYQLGKYHQERGNFDLARTAYEYAITLDSRQLEPRNALAALHAQQGRLDEASALLQQIVADYPEVAHPYNNLGYVYYLQNHYAAAVTTLQQALLLDSGNERARNNLETVQVALANHGEQATVARGLPPPPTPSTLSNPRLARQLSELVTASVAQTRSRGLMNLSPLLEPQARMEVVLIMPNVYELRPKGASDSGFARLKLEKTIVTLAHALPSRTRSLKPVLAMNLTLSRTMASVSDTRTRGVEVANNNGATGMAKPVNDQSGYGLAS
ncbi:MAG: tetratricopeptide repeat protein [Burkholderiaceae bacterium]|nr:tetratricopeptide repeat protein [Burkholderiaceae bacterium]